MMSESTEIKKNDSKPEEDQKQPQEKKETNVAEVNEEQEEHDYGESSATYTPLVSLSEVDATTGEEHEDCLFKERAKLYRFFSSTPEWKERGIGDIKILQDKESKKCRLLMRQEKTLKVILNHYAVPGIELKANSDRSYIWSAIDFSDDSNKPETFAIRFRVIEIAQAFKKKFDEVKKINEELFKSHLQKSKEEEKNEKVEKESKKENEKKTE